MKDDLLNAIATWAILANAATWAWFAAALITHIAIGALIFAIGRRVFDAIARARQVVRETTTACELISADDLDAHLEATWQQLTDHARKETP